MSDNLGQGSRKEFGHLDAISPLVGGITLQGMIVRETNAWIEWLAEQPFIDSSRIGACGNSGGGTLTLFLTATNKRLSAVASCGYPSEFSYVHAKEKKHCACNLLRGSAHLADMPEI
jgi:dienelactone hydrolase